MVSGKEGGGDDREWTRGEKMQGNERPPLQNTVYATDRLSFGCFLVIMAVYPPWDGKLSNSFRAE